MTAANVDLLHWLANSYFDKFEKGSGTDYLNQSIVFDRRALQFCPPGHPTRSLSLIQLQEHLWHRYSWLGEVKDIEEATVLGREALGLCPRGHHLHSGCLTNFVLCLSASYCQLGKITDLDEAIVLGREALALHPRGHPSRSITLTNLALCLSARYQALKVVADLEEAIACEQEVLELCPRGHPRRPTCLSNLTVDLSLRYDLLKAVTDLDEAIALAQEALDLCPEDYMDRSLLLDNLGLQLSARYNQLGKMIDLDESIVLGRKALDVCPRTHPERSTRLHNLATRLSMRYQHLGTTDDLNDAVALYRQALDLCTPGVHHWSVYLNSLAKCIGARFVKTSSRKLEDVIEMFNLYTGLTRVSHLMSTCNDLSAAKSWVFAAESFYHPTVLLAYETSLQLLTQHLATFPLLPRHLHILKDLTSSLAVDAFSACLRCRDPMKAVELLEQGRGVFWNQITRLRSPLEDIITSGPAGKTLADDFTRLTSFIQDIIGLPNADQHDRLCRLNIDLQRVVTNIRELPGHARFLLPSLFSELRCAASDGPVVIVNASKYTCDALVVFIDRNPVHIPLSITKSRVQDLSSELQTLTLRARTMDVTRDLGHLLRELWEEVVSPIAEFLQTVHPAYSRVWWCPTAEFSLLPLHAAGPYRKGQPNFSHLYISSYTATLRALIRARRRHPLKPPTNNTRFVAIGQAKATGESELVSVASELSLIGHRIDGLATFTCIEGQGASLARVSEVLSQNEWVHLACHGLPNRKQPFESAFALSDGHFTVEHIMRCKLDDAQFAYLSACHTTVGDEDSPDEVIHLASAMQFAGFRSVIGTMWAVDDGETNKITTMFYAHMVDEGGRLDHTRAAFALNKTMNTLVGIPLDQRILYIHIGA